MVVTKQVTVPGAVLTNLDHKMQSLCKFIFILRNQHAFLHVTCPFSMHTFLKITCDKKVLHLLRCICAIDKHNLHNKSHCNVQVGNKKNPLSLITHFTSPVVTEKLKQTCSKVCRKS